MRTNVPTGRRVTAAVALLVATTLVLGACGNGAEDTTTTGAPAATEATGTTTGTQATAPTTTEAPADPVRLVYATFTVEDSPYAKAFAWLSEEMNKRTNGRVTIEPFYAGSLCAFNEMIDCLRDGRADFTLLLPVASPTDFPYSTVGSVLFVSRDTWAHGEAFNELVADDARFHDEWASQGMQPLWFASIGPAVLGANEPVTSIDWLKGKSIRSTGYFSDALNAVGANPVAMPNSDVYEAIQRGVIDAFYASTLDGAALDNRHFEVTSDWQDLGAGEYINIVTAVSQKALDKLTPDEQNTLFELADQIRRDWFDVYYLPQMDLACDNAIEGGLNSLTIWPDSEMQRFADAAADVVRDRWIADTESTGATGAQEVFDTFVAKVREKEAVSPLEATATERCAARFPNS